MRGGGGVDGVDGVSDDFRAQKLGHGGGRGQVGKRSEVEGGVGIGEFSGEEAILVGEAEEVGSELFDVTDGMGHYHTLIRLFVLGACGDQRTEFVNGGGHIRATLAFLYHFDLIGVSLSLSPDLVLGLGLHLHLLPTLLLAIHIPLSICINSLVQ